mgnify:CR=1 FL=1
MSLLNKYGLKSLLTKNSKMKQSGGTDIVVYNWTIPAFRAADGTKTCPNAGVCAAGCYARSGAYRWSNVSRVHNAKLDASRDLGFAEEMIKEIKRLQKNASKKNKQLYIRIHDAGDFYSLDYTLTWLRIMRALPDVVFYAYTKQVEMFKNLKTKHGYNLPENFKLIFSFGGKQDDKIDKSVDRHSAVFETLDALKAAGYVDASSDDIKALGDNNRIGLVYHGAKSYRNTAWKKAEVAS